MVRTHGSEVTSLERNEVEILAFEDRDAPREAFLGAQEVVEADAAVGRIAAESLAAYPPGIPNVLPGDLLTEETLDYMRTAIEHGGSLRGASDRELRTVRVVAQRS